MDSCSLISGHRRRPGPPEEPEVWAALLLAGTHYAAAAEIPSRRIPPGRRKRLSKKLYTGARTLGVHGTAPPSPHYLLEDAGGHGL